jgi:DNA-binding transcriptional MerR regulator
MTTATQPATYSSAEVCRQTGITYRQLDSWCRHGWLQPENVTKDGRWPVEPGVPGWGRRFSHAELEMARMMARLILLGVTVQQAAKIARDPKEQELWLARVYLAVRA